MNRFLRTLLRWSLGTLDSGILLSELDESYRRLVAVEGRTAANRWRRSELVRAVFLSSKPRLRASVGSNRQNGSAAPQVVSLAAVLSGVLNDVRFGFRTLRKRPLFTTIAVTTMGLGIGAATIVFSLVDGVLLADMPYERSGELVNIWQTFPGWRGDAITSEAWDKIGLTWTNYQTLRDNSQVLSEFAVHRNRTMVLTSLDTPERLVVGEASPGLFPLLGARPILGRGFLPGEEGPGTERLAVLSHALWSSRFGSDPAVVGSTIELDQEPFEVIGVLPRGFRVRSTIFNLMNSSIDTGERALWVPVRFDKLDGSQDHEAVGRLVVGATLDQLRAELDALIREGRTPDRLGFRLTPIKDEVVGGHRSALRLLLAAAGILLVVACANIAALLSGEAVGRRREMATRAALGAGRFRIARQVLTESAILGVLGSLLGIGIAAAGIPSFLSLAPPLPRLEEVGLSNGVLLFSVLAGLGTGCVFGLVPAILLSEDSLRVTQDVGGRVCRAGRGQFQSGMIAAELALTLVLLVAGGLLVRSLLNLTRVDPGFDGSSVATVRVHLPETESNNHVGYGSAMRQILDRIQALPGVEMAGAVDKLPFPGRVSGSTIRIEGRSSGNGASFIIRNHAVIPGYVETMRIPVLAGRTITEADARVGAAPVMLINEQMARQYWSNESPLGARIRMDDAVYDVVGIVGNVRERHLAEAPKAMALISRSGAPNAMCFVARTNGDPESLIPEMRQAVSAVDPDLSLSQMSTMTALIEGSTGSERYRTMLVLVIGILATVLAAVGVFGVTAHSVSKRTREMGIRMALGARGAKLIRGVLYETMLPGLVGIGAGVLGALAVSRLLASYLFGIEAWDRTTFWVVVVLLGSVSVVAALVPASRVVRVDPTHVLKAE
ncbi:ABC transporter permease [Gemmatimonadota bacterium]